MNKNFFSYTPTCKELDKIKEETGNAMQAIKSLFVIIGIGMLGLAAFLFSKLNQEINIMLVVIFVAFAANIPTVIKFFKRLIGAYDTKEMLFTTGEIYNKREEKRKNSNTSQTSTYYLATIKQSNGLERENVEITKNVYLSEKSHVVLALNKDEKVCCIVEKEVDELY